MQSQEDEVALTKPTLLMTPLMARYIARDIAKNRSIADLYEDTLYTKLQLAASNQLVGVLFRLHRPDNGVCIECSRTDEDVDWPCATMRVCGLALDVQIPDGVYEDIKFANEEGEESG